MAYDCKPKGCSRISFFANSELSYLGSPLGISSSNLTDAADVSRAINMNAAYVVAFMDPSEVAAVPKAGAGKGTIVCSASDRILPLPAMGLVMDSLSLSMSGAVEEIVVDLDLQFPNIGLLSLTLTRASDGKQITLLPRGVGQSCPSYLAGRSSFAYDDAAEAEFAPGKCGAFYIKPVEKLGSFQGGGATGVWKLGIQGFAHQGSRKGALYAWCLRIKIR
jgi:hypothetical protein